MSNNISSRSFMNRLKSNPAAAFGILIALVGIAALVWYFFFRGKKGAKGPSKPQITITGMDLKLKPDNSKIEEYRMYEYAKGEQLATNVDLSLSWTNGAGFQTNDVTKLIFKRYVRPSDAIDTASDVLVEKDGEYSDSLTVDDFASGQVTIDGDALKSEYIGGSKITTDEGYVNVIKIYYVSNDRENFLTETNVIEISNNHLKRTLDITEVESVTITVSPGDTASLAIAASNPNMYYKIFSVPGAETPVLKLSSVSTTTGQVKFTRQGSSYKFGIDFGSEDPFFVFEKVVSTSDDLLLKVVDGTSAGKYVIGTASGFKLMTFDDIKSTQANFNNARVRLVGNVNSGSITKPTDMTSAAPAAATLPTGITGLVGHFIPSGLNVSGGTWGNEVSGKPSATVSGNHIGVDGGAVWGDGNSKVIFPQAATFGDTTGDYTMFYVGKYDEKNHGSGSTPGWQGRIFNSDGNSWLSGWHGSKVGVAWHGTWFTVGEYGQAYQGGVNDYIVGTDAVNTFRLNGIDVTIEEEVNEIPGDQKITINGGSYEYSNWKMKEIIFYNKKLGSSEMKQVEDYLLKKHGIKRGKGVLSDTDVIGWDNDFTNQLYGSYWTDRNGISYSKDYGTSTTTLSECMTQAKTEAGVKAVGVRHGATGTTPKCWFLSGTGDPIDWAPDTVASSNNGVHSIHCVDSTKSVLNNCQ